MNIFDRIFLSKEVVSCFIELENLEQELRRNCSIDGMVAFSYIKQETATLLRKKKKSITKQISSGEVTSEILTYRFLYHASRNSILDSRNFVYRGVFSSTGRGHFLIIKLILDGLLRLGDTTEEIKSAIISEIEEEKRFVG